LSDGGIRLAVTGTGRTLAAIQRMLPEHAHEMDGKNGWQPARLFYIAR
jgi:hypothetical protein